MTLMYRGLILAAGAATFSVFATEATKAQSFYETITAVARTEVQKPNKARPAPQREEAAATPTNTENIVVSPRNRVAPRRSKYMVIKEDGYRYVPEAEKTAKSWPNAEIQIARARCNFILRQIKAAVVAIDPIKNGACGDPAPVKLVSVGSKPKVIFDPPALVNCDMVQSLHDWVVNDLQPSARRHLKSPITVVETMSSYSCRNAYGRKNAKLSEHGRANAIDIRGFRTAKKQKARLIAHWGPTQRAINATQLAAAKRKAKSEVLAAQTSTSSTSKNPQPARVALPPANQANSKSATEMVAAAPVERPETASTTMPRLSFRPSFLDNVGSAVQSSLGVAPSRLGGPAVSALADEVRAGQQMADAPAWPVLLASDKIDLSKASKPRARFLREAHRTACQLFGTVLGPEANRAHRNHFHVDLAQRDLGNFCR